LNYRDDASGKGAAVTSTDVSNVEGAICSGPTRRRWLSNGKVTDALAAKGAFCIERA
jgi:hypothetical protein